MSIKLLLIIIVFSGIASSGWAQDTTLYHIVDTSYYNSHMKQVYSLDSANYYKIIYTNQVDTNQVMEKIYFMSGDLSSERSYSKWTTEIIYFKSHGEETYDKDSASYYTVTDYNNIDSNLVFEKTYNISGQLRSKRNCIKWKQKAIIYYNDKWLEVHPEEPSRYYKILYSSGLDTNKVLEKTYYQSGQLRSEKTFSRYIHDITYYNSKWQVVKTKELAEYYKVVQYHHEDTNHVSEKTYYLNGKLKNERNYPKWKMDTTYYNQGWGKINSNDLNLYYYRITLYNNIDPNRVLERNYYKSGNIESERSYYYYEKGLLDGITLEYYENEHLHKRIEYKNGKHEGKLSVYWYNGNTKRIDYYKKDTLVTGMCFGPDGREISYSKYETYPEFPGGRGKLKEYLKKNVKYPKKALGTQIEGSVSVSFIINVNGKLSNIEITKSLGVEFDQETYRLIKEMPSWIPGYKEGEVQSYEYVLTFAFKIPANKRK